MQDGLFGSEKAVVHSGKRRTTDEPVYNRVLECRACSLSSTRQPVPYRGPYPARVAVVGEAPGQQEDARGGPFLGPAGQLLSEHLRINKVIPERLFYMNVVSCFPPKSPSVKTITACSGNAWAQLQLCQPQWVILVGGVALKAMAPWPLWKNMQRTVTNMRGLCWAYKSMYWTAVVHPAAALRQERYMEYFSKDIAKAVSYIKSGPWWSEECYSCGSQVHSYDETGMAWCAACNPR